MFKNFVKIAIRNLDNLRAHAVISIAGLSIGLAAALLMLLWVQDEVSVDKFHQDRERVYRVLANLPNGEAGISTWEGTPYPLIGHLQESFPDLEQVVGYRGAPREDFQYEDREYSARGIYATSNFIKVLSFPLVEGGQVGLPTDGNSVAISESLAAGLFGSNWKGQAVGESIQIEGDREYVVAGVFANVPSKSSLEFDYILNLDARYQSHSSTWGSFNFSLLLKLREGIEALELQERIANVVSDHNEHTNASLILQRYDRKYLHGHFENGYEAGGRIEYVRLFGIAALFLILIACINYTNLTTALAAKRSKEVGVRKSIGASKMSLVSQFMTETAISTMISLVVALVFIKLCLPYFQHLSGKEEIWNEGNLSFWVLLGLIGIGTSLLAGCYPSLVLSSMRPAEVIKGRISTNFSQRNFLRRLIVFQFILAFILIGGTLVVGKQVNFIKSKHLGLDRANVISTNIPSKAWKSLSTYKHRLSQVPGITELTLASDIPMSVGHHTSDPKWEGKNASDASIFGILHTDHNFLKTMKIELRQGRDFSEKLSTDTMMYLINETAARLMKFSDPIGKKLEFPGRSGHIVGVFEDFHTQSLHEEIGPLIVVNSLGPAKTTLLRIDPGRAQEAIAGCQNIFEEFSELGDRFRYSFLDEKHMQKYESEQRTEILSRWFALIAIITSLIGLYGIIGIDAEQRKKEISIRKVLGASNIRIMRLLTRDSLRIISLAVLIATPITYYLMHSWLLNFAYHVDLKLWLFLVTGGSIVLMALATVGFKSLIAASQNPIQNLRNDG